MKKEIRIALYCLLIIAIIVVTLLMLGSPKQINIETGLEPTYLAWENDEEENVENVENVETVENTETTIPETQTPSFEEDVMKDLESFFENNNGYEDVQWEYWFINAEAE